MSPDEDENLKSTKLDKSRGSGRADQIGKINIWICCVYKKAARSYR